MFILSKAVKCCKILFKKILQRPSIFTDVQQYIQFGHSIIGRIFLTPASFIIHLGLMAFFSMRDFYGTRLLFFIGEFRKMLVAMLYDCFM